MTPRPWSATDGVDAGTIMTLGLLLLIGVDAIQNAGMSTRRHDVSGTW